MKESEILQQTDRTFVLRRGRKLIYFAGCDYHRLASHPSVLRAAREGLDSFGLNVSASRLTSGNHCVYTELESFLVSFFDCDKATLVSTGYLAPLVVAQALAGEVDRAFIDERAHACLFDAATMLGCGWSAFRHRDAGSLARAVEAAGTEASLLVLTDGMFSHDGSVAPLADYLSVLPRGSRLLVDESHSAGVLGRTGRGAVEMEAINTRSIIRTVTLSKAFGVYGGVVLGDSDMRKRIFERSRMFVGSTPLPLPLACASLEALRVFRPVMARKLVRRSLEVKEALREAGLPLTPTPGPIVALPPGNEAFNRRLSRALLAGGIYPSLIRYLKPAGQGYFRFVLSSEHTFEQIYALIEALAGTIRPNDFQSCGAGKITSQG